jgi:6-phosphogluconolactonase (cycloisomerase 2 family)
VSLLRFRAPSSLNYSGGNIACFGKIMMVALGIKQVVQHWERNAKDKRATRSYGSFSPDRKFVLSADLGNDKSVFL